MAAEEQLIDRLFSKIPDRWSLVKRDDYWIVRDDDGLIAGKGVTIIQALRAASLIANEPTGAQE